MTNGAFGRTSAGPLMLIGTAIAVIGVAVVNHPRAEDVTVASGDLEEHFA